MMPSVKDAKLFISKVVVVGGSMRSVTDSKLFVSKVLVALGSKVLNTTLESSTERMESLTDTP